jgi:uncharacterized protein (DUF58 family)
MNLKPDSGAKTADERLGEILRQVRRIELRTERMVSSLTAGAFRSAFKGSGLEFEEVREYSAGDDVRAIDWNVTARAGRPYVKVFREERELAIAVLVDVSGSMNFGAIPGLSSRTKLALAAEATAVVAVNAMRNRDRIGLVTFAGSTISHLPLRRGRGHCLRLVREVLSAGSGAGRADPIHALDELRRVARRRTVCFIISDFLGMDDELGDALARAARRHDIIGLRITDPGEERLPEGSYPLALVDPENDSEIVVANGARSRASYAAAWAAQRKRVADVFRGAGCDLVDLRTDSAAAPAMMRFFGERRRRIHG